MKTSQVKTLDQLVESGIVQLTRGKIISKADMTAYPGRFPVYSSAKENGGKFGEYGRYMFDEELITWSVDGGGRLFHRPKHKFSVTNVGGILRIRDRSALDYKYLYYVLSLRHSEIRFDWVKKAHPSVIKKVYCGIPVLPLPEQQRIAGILDEAFEGITTAKANAEKNLENALAIFESYLLSVFKQRGDGWHLKTLEEISLTFGRGKSRHRPRNEANLYGGIYPFIQTGDIRNCKHSIIEYSQTYSDLGLAQSKLWPKGTVCITIAANIAETGILGFDACFPDSIIGVVTNPKEADAGFVEYLLQSFRAHLQGLGKGSAQANINIGTFENELFPFPSVEMQKRITANLDSLYEETQRLESIYQQKLQALEDLKNSILDQAFSGGL